METNRTTVRVTPEIARKWLDSSKGNRSLRSAKVLSYKADMQSGAWHRNGDVIRFFEDGTLYDGHHRLNAVIAAGVAINFDVCTISKEAANTIDKGALRTTSDDLHFSYGYHAHEASTLSTAIKMIILHDLGRPSWASLTGDSSRFLTSDSVMRRLNANKEELEKSMLWTHENVTKSRTFLKKGAVCAMHYLAGREYGDEGIEFLKKIVTGYDIKPDSMEDKLRTWLIGCGMKVHRSDMKMRVYTITKCMKTRVLGREIKHLTNMFYRQGTSNNFFRR